MRHQPSWILLAASVALVSCAEAGAPATASTRPWTPADGIPRCHGVHRLRARCLRRGSMMHDRSCPRYATPHSPSTFRAVKRLVAVLIVSSLGTAAVSDGVASGSPRPAGVSSDLARSHRPKARAVELPRMLPATVPPVQMPNLVPPEHDPVGLPQATPAQAAPAGAHQPTPDTQP